MFARYLNVRGLHFSIVRLSIRNINTCIHKFTSIGIPSPPYVLGKPEIVPILTEKHTNFEITKLLYAGKIVRKILDDLSVLIKPGFTTADINAFIIEKCIENAVYPSPLGYKGFPSASCTSVNEIVCHGLPSADKILRNGDLISVDVSIYAGGVHGDACCTYLVKDSSDQFNRAQRLLTVARQCCDAGIDVCGPGVAFTAIAQSISQAAFEAGGYRVVAGIRGHGIGVYFHGPPDVIHSIFEECSNVDEVMQPGNVFTIEPCIVEPGKQVDDMVALPVVLDDGWSIRTTDSALAAQFEETVLITDAGVEVLTS